MQKSYSIKPVIALIAAVAVTAVILFAFASPGILNHDTGEENSVSDGDLDNTRALPTKTPYSGTIRILTTPDIHSRLFAMSDNDTGSRIGRIGALADRLGEENENTLYLFAGDLGEGSFYHRYSGVPEVKSYAMAGVDAAVPGNHAFDFSTGLFKEWVTNASYPVICANLDFSDSGLNDSVRDYTILDAGGVKVGVFGIITPRLERMVNLDDDVVLYENTAEIGNSTVKLLKEEGAEIIIALTHQERDEDVEFAESVPGIDLIIGGHDHLVWNETITAKDSGRTLIVHAGKYGEETDSVDLTVENGVVTKSSIGRYEITEDMPDDTAITSFLMPHYENYTDSLSDEIGYTTVPLDVLKKSIRTGETNAGDLITDTIRDEVPDVDIAFINSGSIRGDCIIPAGGISYLTLDRILPYENIIVKIQMTGDEIRETLERSASAIVVDGDGCPGADRVPSGGFLQVSGVRFDINTGADTFCIDYAADSAIPDAGVVKCRGERIENLSVVTGSGIVPIDPAKTYSVAVSDYIAGGGDGYTNLEAIPEGRKYNTEINLINLLAAEIEQNSPISPETDGRIIVTNLTI